MLPREHGAYAEIGFPLLGALIAGTPSVGSICLTLATLAAFLAHEPLLVLLGRRGPRALEALQTRARRRLLILALFTVLSGVAGLVMAPASVWVVVVVLATLTLPLSRLIVHKREKTLFGESLVVVMFSGAGAMVALAGGVPWLDALITAWIWSATFTLSTAAVHAILARTKRRGRKWLPTVVLCIALALGLLSPIGFVFDAPWTMALLPGALTTAGLVISGVTARHLKRVGIVVVISSVATLVCLVLLV